MGIFDLFSTSFLFSIAIIIILIGGIFAYVSYRMSEQDHKLTSMVNLVSILAQDLRFVKSKLVSSVLPSFTKWKRTLLFVDSCFMNSLMGSLLNSL